MSIKKLMDHNNRLMKLAEDAVNQVRKDNKWYCDCGCELALKSYASIDVNNDEVYGDDYWVCRKCNAMYMEINGALQLYDYDDVD